MLFQELSFENQIKFIKSLHKRFNKYLFGGELKTIKITIEDISTTEQTIYSKFFNGQYFLEPRKITFSYEFVYYLELQVKEEYKQIRLISRFLLHEMINQYCFEKKINAAYKPYHNETWMNTAEQFGLISIYNDNDELEIETLDDKALELIKDIKFQV